MEFIVAHSSKLPSTCTACTCAILSGNYYRPWSPALQEVTQELPFYQSLPLQKGGAADIMGAVQDAANLDMILAPMTPWRWFAVANQVHASLKRLLTAYSVLFLLRKCVLSAVTWWAQ